MQVLFVDDSKDRYYAISVALMYTGDTLDCACTMNEAIELLEAHHYDCIFIDYDLGENVGSGRGVAEYIARDIYTYGESSKFNKCMIIIHSSNPSGSRNMMYTLQDAIKYLDNLHSIDIPLLFYAPLKHADKKFLKLVGLL